MSDPETLYACPFCGGDDLELLLDDTTMHLTVSCAECGSQAQPSDDRGEAISNWNRRVPGLTPAKLVTDDDRDDPFEDDGEPDMHPDYYDAEDQDDEE